MTTSEPIYPQIVAHIEYGGNAAGPIGRTIKAMRRAGVSQEQITAFTNEAKSGDYDHVFDTIGRWVTVE